MGFFYHFKAEMGLLPFYPKSTARRAFTVLREKRRTFTLPPPYGNWVAWWHSCAWEHSHIIGSQVGEILRQRNRKRLSVCLSV